MTDIDHSLVYNVRKFITGANAHSVRTWIFCYENLPAGRRDLYEKLLREFVATHNSLLAKRMQLEATRRRISR
jgi:hypothetical protein